jgi:predicted cobalt transporter CbtA
LLLLLVFCLFIALACFGAIGWVLFSGVEVGIELIFLLHVGGVLGLLFLGLAGWLAVRILPAVSAKPEAAASPAKASPAAKKAPEEVSKTAS